MSEQNITNTYCDGIFCIDDKYGFLPMYEPINKLPQEYCILQNLVDNLPNCVKSTDSLQKLLINLPEYDLSEVVEPSLLQALYRTYCFIASYYLLEPSYREFVLTGNYGAGNDKLPKKIAKPFVTVAKKLNVHPWLDYHYAYASGNYVKIDKNIGLHWKNLQMANSFTNSSNESGFIMIHVYMNELTPQLVKSIKNIQDGDYSCIKNNYETLREINKRRNEMWQASEHKKYNDFRIFIMGIKGNTTIFPKGVIYEGEYNNEPQYFRGQTGAQDDIIPVEDIVSGVTNYYPNNDLTQYLMELRSYRPIVMQKYMNDLSEHFNKNSLKDILIKNKQNDELCYLLAIINEIFLFRYGHWQFVKKYIMDNTKYPTATGGTPIVSWLPNQIEACICAQKDIIKYLDNVKYTSDLYNEIKKSLEMCKM